MTFKYGIASAGASRCRNVTRRLPARTGGAGGADLSYITPPPTHTGQFRSRFRSVSSVVCSE